MQKDSALADFLRNRRAALQPSDVGLPCGPRRRVAGLRREEVAALAGVSTEYYLRIEQGRETNPSDQVLGAIGRALRLDDVTTAYLYDLVPRCTKRRVLKDLNPAIQSLIDSWPHCAAHIYDTSLNVVAANPIARALFPAFEMGINPVRSLFIDPVFRRLYQDWDTVTEWTVRWVRAYAAHNPDSELTAVIDELLADSDRFRTLWACPTVNHDDSGTVDVVHPEIGPLSLLYQHMTLGSGHMIVIYWPEPNSASERGLQRLAAA